MAQRRDQKEETRAKLLETAAQLVAERGFAATRTADVASATGVSHGALFVHFPTREALLVALTSDFGRALTDRLHALALQSATFGEVLTAHLRCLTEHEALYTRLLTERATLPSELGLTWTGIQSAASHHLGRVAEAEMRCGRMRKVPLHFLFNTWIGLVHHYLANRELFVTRGSVLKKHGPALVEHYLALLEP